MSGAFDVRTTPHVDRLLKKLASQHPQETREVFTQAVTLKLDPYNRNRRYPIKKLEGVRRGDGRYRLKLRRWRFRYDIAGQDVWLHYCGLRREDTY